MQTVGNFPAATNVLSYRWLTRLLSIACLAAVATPTFAGTLRLGSPIVSNNQYTFPVVLQGNAEGVAALDFRLAYDPNVFAPVSAQTGANATQAQKQVSSNLASPGEFVVVMMGFNQNAVQPGEVVQVVLEKIGQPEDGKTIVRIAEPTLATNVGIEVDSRGTGRTIDFSAPAKADDDETDAEPDPDNKPNDSEMNAGPENQEDSGPSTSSAAGGNPLLIAQADMSSGERSTPPSTVADRDKKPTAESTATNGNSPSRATSKTMTESVASTGSENPEVRDPESTVLTRRANGNTEKNQDSPKKATGDESTQGTTDKELTQHGGSTSTNPDREGRQTGNGYATLTLLLGGVAVGFFILRRVAGS